MTKPPWALPDVDRVVFIDDFCGTGDQATEMSQIILPVMRNVARRMNIDLEVFYLTLLGTTTGLMHIRTAGLFDRVASVSELDPTYRVFGDDSQFYRDPPEGLTKMDAERIARHYGGLLKPGDPVGYGDSPTPARVPSQCTRQYFAHPISGRSKLACNLPTHREILLHRRPHMTTEDTFRARRASARESFRDH